jgi:transposase InsO family protein
VFYRWQKRYGRVNEHNAWISRDFWLEKWEKQAIIEYYKLHKEEGYRRLTYMMLDADIVAASPSSVYRVLKSAGYLTQWNPKPTSEGQGFIQPLRVHEEWHVDVSYINISGTFYYLCSLLDGYSRYIVHWEIRERMTEADIEIIIQRALEKSQGAKPKIISDNGPQFIARDFKEFIRIKGMRHVRTSPYYPQSNGKIERWHQSLKRECIRKKVPLSKDDAERLISDYVEYYNQERLHSTIGYVAPVHKLMAMERTIFAMRDKKLEDARELRKKRRAEARRESSDLDLMMNPYFEVFNSLS